MVASACVVAGACSSSSKAESPLTTPTPATKVRPCGPSEEGCTSDQVIAAVNALETKAGATGTAARCLARLSGTGKSAVNQAFDVPKPGENEAAIACAGSERRLRTILAALNRYFEKHPFG